MQTVYQYLVALFLPFSFCTFVSCIQILLQPVILISPFGPYLAHDSQQLHFSRAMLAHQMTSYVYYVYGSVYIRPRMGLEHESI